jgi:hypothetical protein
MFTALHRFQQQVHPVSAAQKEGSSSLPELHSWITSLTAGESPRQICEIGLNSGESAAAWLCAFPSASYVGFDMVRFNATVDADAFLSRAFPGRFRVIPGDTLKTLPAYARAHRSTCDVVSIDGGHSFSVAFSDLSYMRLLAREGPHTVVMDDLRCTQWWCKPPTATWHHFVRRGVVVERGCVISGCCTGWCWGSFNKTAPQPQAEDVCGTHAKSTTHGKKCIAKARAFVWDTSQAGDGARGRDRRLRRRLLWAAQEAEAGASVAGLGEGGLERRKQEQEAERTSATSLAQRVD